MLQKRTNTALTLGELYASNIFGNGAATATVAKSVAQPLQPLRSIKISSKSVIRYDKMPFPDFVENIQPLQAVLPYVTNEVFAETMDNYRLYVANYNKRIISTNEIIQANNALIQERVAKNELTEVQIAFSKLFYDKNKHVETIEFNLRADEFNKERGMCIEKRKYSTIKYATEIVFQQLIYLYSMQLSMYSNQFVKFGVAKEQDIPQLEANSHHITNLKRNGELALNVCNATVRNHIHKLEEAGILLNYNFRGHKKGVKYDIHPEILVVFDGKTKNLIKSENQRFNPQTCKKFTDNNEDTRTIITIDKTKSVSEFQKGTPTADFPFVFDGNIPVQDEKVKLGGGEKSVKVFNEISEKLENIVLSDTNLPTRLASGEFYNYTRIDKRILEQESYRGTMARCDMNELCVNELLKSLSKIYRNSTPYAGSWQKARTALLDNLFWTANGNGRFLMSKEFMIEKLEQYLFAINKANKFFVKTSIRPLNPHDYLDRTRTKKTEIGFFLYAKNCWTKRLKDQENAPKLQKQAVKKAEFRATNTNNDKKFNVKLNQFFKNRISMTDFIDYVKDNLPKNYLEQLSTMVLKMEANKS